jgi:hypothetical protein
MAASPNGNDVVERRLRAAFLFLHGPWRRQKTGKRVRTLRERDATPSQLRNITDRNGLKARFPGLEAFAPHRAKPYP